MKPSNRFLLGFGAGIGVLVLVTVGLALTLGRESSALLPANTPEGVVQRFLLALREEDYAGARSYLEFPNSTSAPSPPPSRDPSSRPAWKASLGKTTITGDRATIEVVIDVFSPSNSPFGNPVRSREVTFMLARQPDGDWVITQPGDGYWYWFIYY